MSKKQERNIFPSLTLKNNNSLNELTVHHTTETLLFPQPRHKVDAGTSIAVMCADIFETAI